MKLSIVIVNFRGWDDLETCLDSLAYLLTGEPPETEIIVVDNCSDDGRLAPMSERFHRVRFIENTGTTGLQTAVIWEHQPPAATNYCSSIPMHATRTSRYSECFRSNPSMTDPP